MAQIKYSPAARYYGMTLTDPTSFAQSALRAGQVANVMTEMLTLLLVHQSRCTLVGLTMATLTF